MAKTTTARTRKAALASLGPGIHPARIDVRAGGQYRLRTLAGERIEARLAEGVDAAFADACLRDGRTVLVTPGEDRMAVILGALQTSFSTSLDQAGTLRSRGKRIELEADEGLVLRVGKSALVMDRSGALKLVGQRMTVNVADVVRVLSTLCELP